MIENATNLTNATVRASNGFLGFLSDYWQELSALATIITIILVVVGMVFKWHLQKKQHTHEKEMLKSQQEYDEKILQEEKESIQRDKKVIYDWLCDKTKHLEPNTVGSPHFTYSWPSTEEISSAIDLTEERVNYICTHHNGIQRQEKSDLWPNQELGERWAVRKFVRDDD
jgi:hypothetical protein